MAIAETTANASPEARAASGSLTTDDYMALVQSRDVGARVAAAGRPDAPMGALIAFAQDSKAEVRVAVAGNEAIGRLQTVCESLARDKNVDVARALVANAAVGNAHVSVIATSGPKAVRDEARARLEA